MYAEANSLHGIVGRKFKAHIIAYRSDQRRRLGTTEYTMLLPRVFDLTLDVQLVVLTILLIERTITNYSKDIGRLVDCTKLNVGKAPYLRYCLPSQKR